MSLTLRISADVGGTFTDVVAVDGRGGIWTRKVPSTPPDFERAVLHALGPLLSEAGALGSNVGEVVHGTTVATNAVLEHRGARTALITTLGCRDVLELRRVRAPQIYDLFFQKPAAIVDRRLRLELTERMSASGEVLTPLAEKELPGIVQRLREENIESVAVCFLHSYAFPKHEERVGEYLRRELPGVPVSLSCEVVRERREYERTATTAVNAYVQPVMKRYLEQLGSGLRAVGVDAPLMIMQSAGGLASADEAARRPVFILESGPAAGVLGALHIAHQLDLPNLISFDMGGTTAKAAMIEDGQVTYSSEYEVGASMSAGNRLVGGGGEMILAPTIDIAEVGAGGGSIAYLDAAGGLRVGPRSAGAVPGPACYQRGGTEPTVTDANVLLGYIRPGKLAAGDIDVEPDAARRAIVDRIARPLEMDPMAAALGIHRIADAHMLRALREVSTQRGRDPRMFSMLAFGGSGPVHAASLARELGVRRVVIPPVPGLFSAMGLLIGGLERHDVRSCQLRGDELNAGAFRARVDEMQDEMLAGFQRESATVEGLAFESFAEVRYVGQASRIRVRLPDVLETPDHISAMRLAFETEHARLYGHRSEPDHAIEVVAVRLIGRAPLQRVDLHNAVSAQSVERPRPARAAMFGEPWGTIQTASVRRSDLRQRTRGPLLIDEYDSTIVVPPDFIAHLDAHGNIVMELENARES